MKVLGYILSFIITITAPVWLVPFFLIAAIHDGTKAVYRTIFDNNETKAP